MGFSQRNVSFVNSDELASQALSVVSKKTTVTEPAPESVALTPLFENQHFAFEQKVRDQTIERTREYNRANVGNGNVGNGVPKGYEREQISSRQKEVRNLANERVINRDSPNTTEQREIKYQRAPENQNQYQNQQQNQTRVVERIENRGPFDNNAIVSSNNAYALEANIYEKATKLGVTEKETIDKGFLGKEVLEHGLIEKVDHDLLEYEADVEVLDYESQVGDEEHAQEETLQRIKQEREIEHNYYRTHYHPHEHLKTIEHNHYVDHVKNVDHIDRVEKIYNTKHRHIVEDRHLHEHVYNTQHLHNWYHRDVAKHRKFLDEEEFNYDIDLGEEVVAIEGEERKLDGWVKEGDSHHDVGVFEIWDEQLYRLRPEDRTYLNPQLTATSKSVGGKGGLRSGKPSQGNAGARYRVIRDEGKWSQSLFKDGVQVRELQGRENQGRQAPQQNYTQQNYTQQNYTQQNYRAGAGQQKQYSGERRESMAPLFSYAKAASEKVSNGSSVGFSRVAGW